MRRCLQLTRHSRITNEEVCRSTGVSCSVTKSLELDRYNDGIATSREWSKSDGQNKFEIGATKKKKQTGPPVGKLHRSETEVDKGLHGQRGLHEGD